MKGKVKPEGRKKRGSRFLILTQFFLAVVFITSAMIAKDQSKNVIEGNLGYNRDNIASLKVTGLTQAQRDRLKTRLEADPRIESLSASVQIPVVWINKEDVISGETGSEKQFRMDYYGIEHNFLEFMQIPLIKGRGFVSEREDFQGFVINKAASHKFGWDEPIGKIIRIGEKSGPVIGETENFIFGDIETEAPAVVLYLEKENLNYLHLRYYPGISEQVIHDAVNNLWTAVSSDLPFEFITFDEYFGKTLGFIIKLCNFFNLIGLIAIVFSCLGLVGLASFIVERRNREIGIRKVMGASVQKILWTISKEFFILILIANAIGFGLIHFIWDRILRTGLMYIGKIDLSVYFIVLLLSMGAAFIAIISQSYKAAVMNPVRVLKYE